MEVSSYFVSWFEDVSPIENGGFSFFGGVTFSELYAFIANVATVGNRDCQAKYCCCLSRSSTK